MLDCSKLLTDKTEAILTNWIEAVRQDRQIESADTLPPSAVKDHIPHVLVAMTTVLSKTQESEIRLIVSASLEHGLLRAEQGYDPSEVAQEYRLLRQVIFTHLETDLLTATVPEVMRTVRLIDAVLDEAIAQCFKSYVDERLRELQQIQSQLTLTNQELNRLAHANQETLAHLAHELKTPLNSIIGYSELFLRKEKRVTEVRDTRGQIEHIERVLRNGRQLLRLVNDALELSRAEAGKIKLRLISINVISAINAVIDTMQPLADDKGLKITLKSDRAPDTIITDPQRFQQIITNLISNAIRYTEVGSIDLNCEILPDERWAIAVKDTGIGIATEHIERIFEPFFQVGETNRYQFPPDSTGLGLAIVSRLVTLLQGKIKLVSQVGVGSTFTVILPLEIKKNELVSVN
ncbi:HAMP domain-containing sensor histidine kinase [Kamptonema sp. UHCC 0994]|uniref:sensor histidine kinase n=1 Tax=Kamptonema sp. UHCC 0994 TaxID=3031329 RepID=UPI0023BABD3D|nr:HAMP domain-containing sensor histidine kinase [Kamptonema sp. UHCC 0994]MDF0556892.1 HAMP domain-containing sensor histidine kinase [Kamptonema sp. UHCC 0994]